MPFKIQPPEQEVSLAWIFRERKSFLLGGDRCTNNLISSFTISSRASLALTVVMKPLPPNPPQSALEKVKFLSFPSYSRPGYLTPKEKLGLGPQYWNPALNLSYFLSFSPKPGATVSCGINGLSSFQYSSHSHIKSEVSSFGTCHHGRDSLQLSWQSFYTCCTQAVKLLVRMELVAQRALHLDERWAWVTLCHRGCQRQGRQPSAPHRP